MASHQPKLLRPAKALPIFDLFIIYLNGLRVGPSRH